MAKLTDREKTLAMVRALYANYRLPEWAVLDEVRGGTGYGNVGHVRDANPLDWLHRLGDKIGVGGGERYEVGFERVFDALTCERDELRAAIDEIVPVLRRAIGQPPHHLPTIKAIDKWLDVQSQRPVSAA